jgi:hypothetical protein
VVGNRAANYAGGVDNGYSLTNCIVYYNTASNSPNESRSAMSYCCTTPQPTVSHGGNITNAPLFANLALGDFRLQSNSPCINAGNNSAVYVATDLDGNPRIVGSTVDIGAYEFQTPASTLAYAWAQDHGLPTDGTADFTDPDGDRMNNWQE